MSNVELFIITFLLIYYFFFFKGKVAILAKCRDEAKQQIKDETEKKIKSNKNDYVRLFHLRKDPDSAMAWDSVTSILNRAQLDSRKSDTVDVNGGKNVQTNNNILTNFK